MSLPKELEEALVEEVVVVPLEAAVSQQSLELLPKHVVAVLAELGSVLDLLYEYAGQLQRVLSHKSDEFTVLSQVPVEKAELFVGAVDLHQLADHLGHALVEGCFIAFVL